MIKIYGTKHCYWCRVLEAKIAELGLPGKVEKDLEETMEAAKNHGARDAPFIVDDGGLKAVGYSKCLEYLRGVK